MAKKIRLFYTVILGVFMQRDIEKLLKIWYSDVDRLPIVLRGARQVGKTFIIRKFANDFFDNLVEVNFEFQRKFLNCFESLEPLEIVQRLENIANARIVPGNTLLFLDEIQECPRAILALRYFKEKMPDLHVMAAGSLLEFILHDEKNYSFPVGRVQFMYLKPFSFEEFLKSLGQNILLERLASINIQKTLDEATHQHLMDFVRQYLFIGGMPAAIKKYLEKNSFLECQKRQIALLETYYTDFGKYATKAQHKYLQLFFERAPHLIGQKFKFSKIDPEIRARELKVALDQLCWAGLLNRIYFSNSSGLPIKGQKKEDRFKLLFVDVGLLQCAMEMDYEEGYQKNIIQINSGSIAEQFVGQELLVYGNALQKKELFYWDREKKGGEAEVDYVIQQGSYIIPIEVKAGTTGQLKSLHQFMTEKQSNIGVRISQLPLNFEKNILSIPFYLIGQLQRLIKEAL